MNFLRAPKAVIHDNAVMDEEQTLIAANFVEELLDLQVFLQLVGTLDVEALSASDLQGQF
jgi:hypothetical protein